MNQKKNRALHWPIGIVLAIFGIVLLCIWTIKQASNNPVMMDDFYFQKYQDVDQNYHNIQQIQKQFNKKYIVKYNLAQLSIGQNELIIKIVDKQNSPIADADIKVRITRPLTNVEDKNIKVISQENGSYKLEKFKINNLGRWQILSKVKVGDLISFIKTDINATK